MAKSPQRKLLSLYKMNKIETYLRLNRIHKVIKRINMFWKGERAMEYFIGFMMIGLFFTDRKYVVF